MKLKPIPGDRFLKSEILIKYNYEKDSKLSIFTASFSAVIAQKTVNDPNAEKRNVSGYHAIEVGGGIDLYLSQGEEAVAVSASETKYRDRIKTEVKNGVLKIWYDHKKQYQS